MAKPNLKERLFDILDAIQGAQNALQNLSFEDYYQSWIVRRAVERAIEIISEASRHIPDEIKQQMANTNWRHVADIGNILRHEYHNVSDRMIYNIAIDYFPELEVFIQSHYDRL